MKLIKNVIGSQEASQPLIMAKDIVYVHKNIKKIELEEFGETIEMWQYDEEQYSYPEYIEMMAGTGEELGKQLTKARIENFKKDMMIKQLGQAQVKNALEIMKLKKGGE